MNGFLRSIMNSPRRAALLAIVATLAVLVAGVAALVWSGIPDVAASPTRTSSLDRVLAAASTRSIRRHAAQLSTPAAPNDSVLEGAAHYAEMCVTCHGAPGVERDDIGKGLYPVPPHLDSVARNWSNRDLFWIVKHGIRMTGMPASGRTHTDSQVSAIVAFVRLLHGMTPSQYRQLTDSAKALAEASHEHHR
jgi:mono/diheme cytochrome c family protein